MSEDEARAWLRADMSDVTAQPGSRRHPGPAGLRLRQADGGVLPAAARRAIARGRARAGWRGVPVTTAADLRQASATAMQVALSAGGLRALGLPEPMLAGFSRGVPLRHGGRGAARRAGWATSAPTRRGLAWGGREVPDVLVVLYAAAGRARRAARAGRRRTPSRRRFDASRELATTEHGRTRAVRLHRRHQPAATRLAKASDAGRDADLAYGNLIAAGRIPARLSQRVRPVSPTGRCSMPDAPGAALLPPAAEDARDARDLGRNGTYLVFRELAPGRAGFWRFVAAQRRAAAVALAEAMVGRQHRGRPAASPLLDGADPWRRSRPGRCPTATSSPMTPTPTGCVCPLGAHVRRANPRTGDMPGGVQGLARAAIRTLGLAGGR